MAATLEALIAQLNETRPYQAMTQEQIKTEATQRYQSLYDQKRLSAQQSYETSDAALVRQLDGLASSYDRQRDESRAQTRRTYAQANRQALSRGMQRSSYNNASLANINLAGDEALSAISRAQTAQEGDIGQQRTLLSQQLAQQLRQYDADQLNDVLAYMDTLEAREYERSTQSLNARNELAMKIYEYQHELEQEAIEQARWEAEFKAKYSSGSSKKKSGSSSGKKQTTAASAPQKSAGSANRNMKAMAM